MPEAQSIGPLFHSKGKMEALGLNSSSLPPLRAERKKKGGGVALLGTLGAVVASLLTRPEIMCLFIEFLLVLRKLPSFHWVVILAIVC